MKNGLLGSEGPIGGGNFLNKGCVGYLRSKGGNILNSKAPNSLNVGQDGFSFPINDGVDKGCIPRLIYKGFYV